MIFRKKGVYTGQVVFVNGDHFPVGKDGHANKRQRVLWDAENGVYNWAKPSDPTHLGLYHARETTLNPGEE